MTATQTMIELGHLERNGPKYYYDEATKHFLSLSADGKHLVQVTDQVTIKKLQMRLYNLN